MFGILIQLAISYMIIYWAEKGNLSVLGLLPTNQRIKHMLLFLFLAGSCSSVTFFLRMYYGQERWIWNPNFNLLLLANGIWYTLKSVLYEELIFRGVLFYLLIKKWGWKYALLISATAFGMYHWFTYEIFNDPVKMIWIFLITALAGVVYGMGYLKTGLLLIPIGMHVGWNFVSSFVFSNGNIGAGLLVEKMPVPQVQVSYFSYGMVSFAHLILFYTTNILVLSKRKMSIQMPK